MGDETLARACARIAVESPLLSFDAARGGGFRVVGRGAGLVVILPGIVGSADALAALAFAIEGSHRTCLVHYPAVPSLAALWRALDAMCGRVGPRGPMALVGGSFGALVAQAWLARAPGAIGAVVLSGAGPPDPARARRNERLLPWMGRLPMAAWRGLLRTAVRLSTARAPERAYWRTHYRREIDALGWAEFESRYRIGIDIDRSGPMAPAAVSAWPGRLLVLEGARDAVANGRTRTALRAVFPQAVFREFAEAGHGLALEQPTEWLGVVSAFLRDSN